MIRSSYQGESHGGVYIVDLENHDYHQVLDWNNESIKWDGRGGDRGLRGIAFYNGRLYLAASDEIFVFDPYFRLVESYQNQYLKQCHEIFVADNILYITSTKFDAIILFDLLSRTFIQGYCLRYSKIVTAILKSIQARSMVLAHGLGRLLRPTFTVFDPMSDNGPHFGDTTHLNNVTCKDDAIYVSGVHLGFIAKIRKGHFSISTLIPYHTHNAQPFKNGAIYNHTASNQLAYQDHRGRILVAFPIPTYPKEQLVNTELPKDHARQGFGRGLCITKNDLVIGGSSPATISLYQFGNSSVLQSVNISKDIRNAIHGLEIWPF